MTKNRFYSLILAGGQGTRLWPQSTSAKPKQYLKLSGEHSLLESSLERVNELSQKNEQYIVSVKAQEQLIKDIDSKIFNAENMILEPAGKNTAPCLFLALLRLLKDGAQDDDFVGVFPSDHVIETKVEFQNTLQNIFDFPEAKNYLCTIGIAPHCPHTGYGYIQRGDLLSNGLYKVNEFKEKPTEVVATEYLQSGDYYWNAGIFVGSVGCFMKSFKEHAPEIYALKDELEAAESDEQIKAAYDKMPNISIDYALMENAQNVATLKAKFGWNDLGSWDAFATVLPENDGNHLTAAASYLEKSSGNIVYAPGKAVALVGMDNFIVVHTEKALMIVPKDQAQKVKEIREFLKTQPKGEGFL